MHQRYTLSFGRLKLHAFELCFLGCTNFDLRCFLLTHAHLDHINSLVVSAGSLRGARKRVYALKQTLEDLELVFSDRVWPNLASWKEDDDAVKLLYSM